MKNLASQICLSFPFAIFSYIYDIMMVDNSESKVPAVGQL